MVSDAFILIVATSLPGRVRPVVFLLVPDQVQPRVYNTDFAPNLKDDAVIVVASGYNVFYKLLEFKPSQDVVMVAPRYVLASLLCRSMRGADCTALV